MAVFEVEGRPYYEILHTLIRHDDDEMALEQLPEAMAWLEEHQSQITKVCTRAERDVLRHLADYWTKHGRKDTPSRKALEDLIRTHEQPKVLLDILEQYDHHEEDLEVLPVGDLNTRLDQRISDHGKWKMSNVLTVAAQINISAWKDDLSREKTVYTGPRDAMAFLVNRMQQGILIDDVPVVGGALAKTVDSMADTYAAALEERKAGTLRIPTGIDVIDNHMGGLCRKTMNGILGSIGQRKTGLARTIAYWAARAGFRVLHIPLESSYAEEEMSYVVMHAHAIGAFRNLHKVTRNAIDSATLTDEDKSNLFDRMIPHFKKCLADNITIYEGTQSWPDVKAIIERETMSKQVDLVIIDYLTLLSTPGARDVVTDKNSIIQDAKRLAMTANNGKGLCLLTPIQGNRKGYEEAGAADGVWEATSIYQFSELEKSLDNCFYTYFNDEMNAANIIKFGSCKARRHDRIPVCQLEIDPLSGMIGGHNNQRRETHAIRTEDISDLDIQQPVPAKELTTDTTALAQ